MPAAYATGREHLDDAIQLVALMLEHAELRGRAVNDETDARRHAELEIELVQREELVAGRCQASAIAGEVMPLERVRSRFGLSETEARILVVLAALELDPSVRRRIPDATVTVGLVESLVYRSLRSRAASAEELVDDGRLFVHALAELGDPALPWLLRPLRVARRILELARGRSRLDVEIAGFATMYEEPPPSDTLLVDVMARFSVEDAVRRQIDGSTGVIPYVVGPRGSGRARIALGAACAATRAALVVRAGALPRATLASALAAACREATLHDAMLIVCDFDSLSGDPDLTDLAARVLASHAGPLALTGTRNAWPATNPRDVVVTELGVPRELDRVELWTRALGQTAAARIAAARYRITGGTIERCADMAKRIAATRGDVVNDDDVRIAVRNQLDADLSTLGRRVEWKQSWSDLVLPDEVHDELRELVSRVRHRHRVLDEWGFGAKVAKGVGLAALFSGPPGTGKTMVAGLLANELGLDLYQIDVSRMVSKWIGETEKNLARLFDAASAGHVVLLFDEADSLFAKRSEVRSSTDRYANLEVNYLLQRMEEFEGITILTTNLESSVDDAFKRRLAFRIKFPLPEAAERSNLWRALLPAAAAVDGAIDFRALGERYEMSGGYIRNAVLRAAYLAAAEGGAITMHHLQRAAASEYVAMGKL